MKLIDYLLLRESISQDDLEKMGAKLKKLLANDFETLYVIPNFEIFTRAEEPMQHSNLFIDKEDHTFAANYTDNGTLYSIDFWKQNSIGDPSVTLYTGGESEEDVAKVIPSVVKNPSRHLDINAILRSKKKNISESLLNESMSLRSSKPDKKYGNKINLSPAELKFDDIKSYVNMVMKGKQNSLILAGPEGLGKSTVIMKQLENGGMKRGIDYVYVKGHGTPAGIYITLFENKDKIVIFDDCDSAIDDKEALSILQSALDTNEPREVSWRTGKPLKDAKSKAYPQSFTFTGRVFFVTNYSQATIDRALKDRGLIYELDLSREEILDYMKKKLHEVEPHVSYTIRLKALNTVRYVSEKFKHIELSFRTLGKAIKIIEEVDDNDTAERLIRQQCSYRPTRKK